MNPRSKWVGVWAILAAMVTILVGLVYVSVQGNYRQNANDPQIEITQQIAEALNNGAPADQIIPPGSSADLKNSLSPFAALYDKDGNVIGSSAKLNDKDPLPPKGVFDTAKKTGRNMFTWQPEKGVRIAAVVIPVKSGDSDVYVLAGKNLLEIEQRIQQLVYACLIGWIALLLLAALFVRTLARLLHGSIKVVEKETDVVVIEKSKEESTEPGA